MRNYRIARAGLHRNRLPGGGIGSNISCSAGDLRTGYSEPGLLVRSRGGVRINYGDYAQIGSAAINA